MRTGEGKHSAYIRLQKFLAEAGVGSRRLCEKIILDGRVRVNGETVNKLGVKVDQSSEVELDGNVIASVQEKKYILMHKPTGCISSVKDQFGRKTVMDLIDEEAWETGGAGKCVQTGMTGAPGEFRNTGEPGELRETGEPGESARMKESGEAGAPGESARMKESGETGETGELGETGEIGGYWKTGETGEPARTRDTGETGVSGESERTGKSMETVENDELAEPRRTGKAGRMFPVGRLDFNTSGLLLITNDGEFAYMATHPKNEIEKVYEVTINGNADEKKLDMLRSGVILDDGFKTSPATVWEKSDESRCQDGTSTICILIHEGRNRQVRRMFKTVGLEICELKRLAIGGLNISGLVVGEWEYISYEKAMKIREKYKRSIGEI